MTSDMPEENKSGGGFELHDQPYERPRGLNLMIGDMLGEEKSPWVARFLFSQFCLLLGTQGSPPSFLFGSCLSNCLQYHHCSVSGMRAGTLCFF